VPELQRLHADHAKAVLAFELANRSYFAASVSDRGDDFYVQFTDRYSRLLAEQEAGIGAYYVLVAEDGSVLGRFNLVFVEHSTAELGYRVAKHVTGRGVATATVRRLCRLAAERHGLRTLRAATACRNVASQRVLTQAGFLPVGPAEPADLGGRPGSWYQRDLAETRSPVRCLGTREHDAVSAKAISGPQAKSMETEPPDNGGSSRRATCDFSVRSGEVAVGRVGSRTRLRCGSGRLSGRYGFRDAPGGGSMSECGWRTGEAGCLRGGEVGGDRRVLGARGRRSGE